jgi:two-component system, OmpR family, KDP operon response regulator KdpE
MSDGGPIVLVVDDERPIRRFLRISLSARGYQVQEASTGQEALNMVVTGRPDLIILDLGLPDIDGVEVTRQIREWSRLPIIILSVRESEQDKVAALDAGADDYLTKPFGNEELLARMRVALRRSAMVNMEPVFQIDELKVDLNLRQVMLGEREVALTPTEYDLLKLLIQNAGKVVTQRQLLRQVWGSGYEPESHLLHVTISNLRRKIEPELTRPHYILTEPGVGYRFRAPD